MVATSKAGASFCRSSYDLRRLAEFDLFLDMDGVIVDFLAGLEALLNKPRNADAEADGAYNLELLFDCDFATIDRAIQTTPGFWYNLPPLPGLQGWRDLFPLFNSVHILSHPWSYPECYAEKVRWCMKHLGLRPEQVILTAEKHLLSAPGRLLVDDAVANCHAWASCGGPVVCYPTRQNRVTPKGGCCGCCHVLNWLDTYDSSE